MKRYLVGLSFILALTSWAQPMIDIDFGAGTKVQETGFAATGVSTNDYWNFYTRDDGNGGWLVDGALASLKYVDGTVSAAGLTVNNGPGAWANGSTDSMYNDYIYPFGGNLVATVTNLPAGSYDVYVYSQDGNYTVNVGATSYGTQTTLDEPLVNPPAWQQGKQYALFHSVSVGAADALSVTVAPGVHGYAIISGIQIAPPTVATGTPPAIITQPQSQTAVIGGSANFSVTASGSVPLNYQWSHDGSAIAGATASTLHLSGLQSTNAGAYSVVVANAYGSVTSSNAILSLTGAPPVIIMQPQSQTATIGSSVTFRVGARGAAPLSYQWSHDGSAIAAATGSSLNLFGVKSTDAGAYSVVVSNAYGSVTSTNAILTVTGGPPTIIHQPQSQTAAIGGSVSFSVTASGTAPLSYQWGHDGSAIAGATSSTLNMSGLQNSDAGAYSVVVANAYGSVTSSNAILTLENAGTFSLLDIDFGAGTKVQKTGFAATGVSTNDYWNFYTRDDGNGGWLVDGALLNLKYVDGTLSGAGLTVNNGPGAWGNGSTDPMYNDYIYPFGGNLTATVTNLPAGSYDVYVYSQDGNYTLNVGATSYGTQTTLDEPLVNPPVWQQGKQYALFHSVSVGAGDALSLTVAPGVHGYAIISGMQIAPPTIATGAPPSIIHQPQSQTAVIGSTVSFSVTASGTAPLNYQWSHDGSAIAGATRSMLNLSGVQNSDAGAYSVVVSNAYGSVTSSNAILTVQSLGTFSLLDIDFGAGTKVQKTGFAATGISTNDYWNFYTRDDGNGGWLDNGALVNLKYVDGTVSGAGLTVNNGPGAWDNGSTDAMYNDYIYPFGGNLVASVTNLPAGSYDVYVYSQDGNYTLNVGATGYGTETTLDEPLVNPPAWQEGKQYALFHSVSVGAGDTLSVTVAPGVHGYAIISGMQIAASTGTTGTPPSIIHQPQSQTAVMGGSVSFSVAASGTAPLSYQWSHDGNAIAGATGSTLNLSGVQNSDAGAYSVVVSNAYGSVSSVDAILTVQSAGSLSLIDIDFGAGSGPSSKTGFAATGVSTNDYWNYYTRDGNGGWLDNGALENLKFVDGTVSGAGLTVNNGPGAWDNGSSDAMYNNYIYPFGGNLVASVTNLPAGSYDVYVYSSDGNYTVNVGATSYGTETTRDVPLVNPPVWQEGRQYALFHSVSVAAGQTLTLTVSNGLDGYAIISGMQIAPTGLNRPPSANTVTAGTIQNKPISVPLQTLLSSTTDPDGDAVSLTGIKTNSTTGARIVVSGATVTYVPSTNFTGVDYFTFNVSDTKGGKSVGYVMVDVRPANVASGMMLAPARVESGISVSFMGMPGRQYTVQRSTSPVGPWTSMAPITVDFSGVGVFKDTNPPKGAAFYRTVYP